MAMLTPASFSGRRDACIAEAPAAPSHSLAGRQNMPSQPGFLQHNLQKLSGRSSLPGRYVPKLQAAVADMPRPAAPGRPEIVADIMTKGHIHSVREDTPVTEALEMVVDKCITGLPVVDDDGKVVGVVSDYDLLSLDSVTGIMKETGIFPDTDTDWKAFLEVQRLVLKNSGRLVRDVMTAEPLCIRGMTSLEAAARMLLERKVRRLPVVDEAGRLVGMFTRRDVIKAALARSRAVARQSGLQL